MKNNKDIKKYFEETYNKEKNLNVILSQVKKKENTRKKKILQMAATFIVTIGLTAGLVYAGSVVYDKIFKEPQKYGSYNELLEDYKTKQGSQEITEEDEEKAVNIDEATEVANNILDKFGYKKQEFVKKELKKNYIIGAELVYYFTTDSNLNKGIHIGINAEHGKCVMFSDENLKYTKITPDNITKEEAIEKADEIYNLFGLKKGEYQLKKAQNIPYYFQNIGTDQWIITYCKTYDGAFNIFERVEIAYAVENGKLKLYHIWLANDNIEFENNPIKITKEEAEKIALEQDKKLTDNEIENIRTQLQIRQMNSWIYLLEKNGGKYPEPKNEEQADGTVITYPEYETVQNIARKVWTVNIRYKQGEPDPDNSKKYNSKSIFVDTTTGEVIGGSDESYWDK